MKRGPIWWLVAIVLALWLAFRKSPLERYIDSHDGERPPLDTGADGKETSSAWDDITGWLGGGNA